MGEDEAAKRGRFGEGGEGWGEERAGGGAPLKLPEPLTPLRPVLALAPRPAGASLVPRPTTGPYACTAERGGGGRVSEGGEGGGERGGGEGGRPSNYRNRSLPAPRSCIRCFDQPGASPLV